jgi:hypothetical protein
LATSLASFPIVSDDAPGSPHQPEPEFTFPKHSFGKKRNCGETFIPALLVSKSFLHYKESIDTIFCHSYMLAYV